MATLETSSSAVSLINQKGTIDIVESTSNNSVLTYTMKEWREWCEFNHRDDNGKLSIEVVNTSFTGDSGCEVEWNLSLAKNTSLSIELAAGNIRGSGQIARADIKLAAGQLKWNQMSMPVSIELAAGNIEIEAKDWPVKGSSKISVATGNISISSPRGSAVSTQVSKAIGMSDNDFPAGRPGHKLTLEIALGKASHASY